MSQEPSLTAATNSIENGSRTLMTTLYVSLYVPMQTQSSSVCCQERHVFFRLWNISVALWYVTYFCLASLAWSRCSSKCSLQSVTQLSSDAGADQISPSFFSFTEWKKMKQQLQVHTNICSPLNLSLMHECLKGLKGILTVKNHFLSYIFGHVTCHTIFVLF